MLHPSDAPVTFTRFLERRGLVVLDVVGGAALNGRRLLLGATGGRTASHVVATSLVVRGAVDGDDPVENEEQVLRHAGEVLGPELQASLPRVLQRVDVHGMSQGLAMTAVPYLGTAGRQPRSVSRDLVEALPDWFAAVWADSANGAAPVSLGVEAMQLVPARSVRHGAPDRALDVLRKARERLAEFDVPRTLTHGCLCARHVVTSGGAVIGVDDWGRGDPAGDPLRDLGRFAAQIAGDRLPEVLAGRTSFAASVRQLMGEAMALTPVPARWWREVLALSQLEIAVEARLRGDPHGMLRLGRAVRALHGPERAR